MDLQQQLEQWHENNQYDAIIETITAIPKAKRDFNLINHLGRALNNVKKYEEAIAVLQTAAEAGRQDALWNYRVGWAYAHRLGLGVQKLSWLRQAIQYYRRALELGYIHAEEKVAVCQRKIENLEVFIDRFAPKEFEIVALIGAANASGVKLPDSVYSEFSLSLAAWKREHETTVQKETRCLLDRGDDGDLRILWKTAPANSIVRLTVRQEGSLFLICSTPKPAQDDELEAILNKVKKPVYYEDPVLGKFKLEQDVGYFSGKIVWNAQSVCFSFSKDTKAAMQKMMDTIHTLLQNAAEWEAKIRLFAAEELLELKNDNWLENEREPVTAQQFMDCMKLETIEVDADGCFNFWYEDGDLFWGHAIVVAGTLQNGLESATIEG